MSFFATMSLDRWIALASSVGTLIAAIIAALSIRELRLQRSQQFQPRIVPTRASYDLTIDPSDLLGFESPARAALPVFNVGHGVATDLAIKWEVDVDDWINRINALSAKRGAGVGVERDNFGVAYRYKGKHVCGSRTPDVESSQFPFIAPVTADREPTNASVPGSIIALINAYYWSYFQAVGEEDGIYRNPCSEFNILLRISYKDTVGRAYNRTSILSVSVVLATENSSNAEQMTVQYAITPVSNEPPEGYSTVTKIILETLETTLKSAWGISFR